MKIDIFMQKNGRLLPCKNNEHLRKSKQSLTAQDYKSARIATHLTGSKKPRVSRGFLLLVESIAY
jgi:hypothetical protein